MEHGDLIDLRTAEGRAAARAAGLPVPPEPGHAPDIQHESAPRPVRLTLPWCPSVNHYWRHVGPKVLVSEEGRQYRRAVGAVVFLNRVRPFGKARLSVSLVAHPPDKRIRDLDNLLKATLDALKHAGLYDDDGQIDELSIHRGEVSNPGRLTVTVEARP